MAKRYSDFELNEMIFEDLPSDDGSLSSIDDTDDDETYVPEPNNNTLLVIESDSESDDDEDVEILNIEENVTYILPSPQKYRSSNRQIEKIQINAHQMFLLTVASFFLVLKIIKQMMNLLYLY